MVDTSTPNVARMYDHYLGGRDTFRADRDAADQVLNVLPAMRRSAVEGRRFSARAVQFLVGEVGVDQFLDLGMGLPVKDATHEVALRASPGARVAYVDIDPVVVSHGNALLAKPGVAVVVRADLRRPEELLAAPELREHLDFSRPIAVLLVSVLHFIPDAADPHGIVAAIRDALAPGSYLVLSHVSAELVPDKTAVRRVLAAYDRSNAPACPRSKDEVLRFFDGFDLVAPGLVPKAQWRPAPGTDTAAIPDFGWCGVGGLR